MDYKKIAYISASMILVAIIVNFIIGTGSDDKQDAANQEVTSIDQMSDDNWKDAGIDPSKINVIDIEMIDMIDEVIVEKNPVCSGEDFMVSVRAKNPRGETQTLSYRIAGKQGNPVIMG